MTAQTTETPETVAEFRSRANAWLAKNMPRLDSADAMTLERDGTASWQRARELQKTLYEGGFAGICFPRVLNFPREHAADRGVPFNQVRRSKAAKGDQT